MKLFSNLFTGSWRAAWIRDQHGQVFSAKFRYTQTGAILIKVPSGCMVEGYKDGTTSRKDIPAWWRETMTAAEWKRVFVEPANPKLTDIQKKYGAGITQAMHEKLEEYERRRA